MKTKETKIWVWVTPSSPRKEKQRERETGPDPTRPDHLAHLHRDLTSKTLSDILQHYPLIQIPMENMNLDFAAKDEGNPLFVTDEKIIAL